MADSLVTRPSHTLVLGGARSGKTRRALDLAAAYRHKVYVATAEALDDEMAERIARHRAERDSSWVTREAPLELPTALGADLANNSERPSETVLVVDCLTLWLSNVMHAGRDPETEAGRLIAALAAAPAEVILVSNEVGLGIVAENALARAFRDAQGKLNQAVAAAVGTVELVVAGLPLRVKGNG